ncbi:MAG: IPExxxVDY family protein [Chitinophagaceae bacterium]
MKLVLDNDALTECFFEETRLLGIVAPIKDYLFCWHINKTLGVDFRLNNDIQIQLIRKRRNYFFDIYEYCEHHTSLTHYLYNNECDGEYLLPEVKHFDFLWLLKGDQVRDAPFQELASSIRVINSVQLVAELDKEKINNRQNMLF